jgi:hypothetical protein
MELVCPAASPIEPPGHGESVLCGVLNQANDGAHVAGFTGRGQVSPLMSGRDDPNVVAFQCAGQGVPGSPASYCACALWRAQRDAERAGRRGPGALHDGGADRVTGPHHEGVARGLQILKDRG